MMPSSVVGIPSVDLRGGQVVRKENGKTGLELCDVQRTVRAKYRHFTSWQLSWKNFSAETGGKEGSSYMVWVENIKMEVDRRDGKGCNKMPRIASYLPR